MAREIEYVNPEDLTIIGLDTDDRHEHPLFDERVFLPVDENLVKNIIVYSIQQPVLVRKEAGKTLVVDGRQRVRAARKAASTQSSQGEYSVKVPIRDVKADDKRVQGIMISTNELRQDDDVLAKAVKAQRLFDMVGDLDEVAIAFGRSKTTIKNWLLLVEADTRVHAAVKSGKVSVTAAVEVARLKRDEQKDVLESLINAAGGSRVSESQAKAAVTGSKVTAAAASAGTATKGTTKKKSGRTANQQGIKRVWLRKALDTDVAKALKDEQKEVLTWFATGVSPKGTWFDDFRFDAETEMDAKVNKGATATAVAPAVPAEDASVDEDSSEPDPVMTEAEIAAELALLAFADDDEDMNSESEGGV
jgi:ParB family transcriptional regulator, chromosome partitioning protein